MPDAAAPPATGPLLLIDGNSLAYRAFHALPDSISTADGFPTNALYGLAAMMMKMLAEERPGRVVVAWDAPGRTFRHEQEPTYKANRQATPDLFREQSPHFRPMMEAFGFVNTELTGYEADDVIGTLARLAEAADEPVVILTGDRDAFQLVSPRVSVMATGRGVTDTTVYTPDAVRERYGIGPELMTDFRGMVGDPSDNLPGVPGVGEKGASQLLQKYGSLDEILDHASEQTPKRREALTEHADDARKTRNLAVIRTDAPVELDLADVPPLDYGPERMEALRDLFDRFEFGSLTRRLDELAEGASEGPAAPAEVTLQVSPVPATPEDLPMRMAGSEPVALAFGEEGWAVAGEGDEVAVGALAEGTGAALAAALAGLPVTAHDAKAALRATGPALRPVHDTMVAAYLLEPRRRGYPLEELLRRRRARRRGDGAAGGPGRGADPRADRPPGGGPAPPGPRAALPRHRAAAHARAGRHGGRRREARRPPPGRDRRPGARQRRRAARPHLGARRGRVRDRARPSSSARCSSSGSPCRPSGAARPAGAPTARSCSCWPASTRSSS